MRAKVVISGVLPFLKWKINVPCHLNRKKGRIYVDIK